MRSLWHIARILTGIVFIFSGFVKGIDPWGSAYKVTDYFNAWGMEALNPLVLSLGMLQAATEFAIGIALITNVFVSFFAAVAMVLMFFFTGLTFYIAISNPVSDCGCFGDALKLTNWQTFFKNVVLLTLTVIVVAYRKRYRPVKISAVRLVLGVITLVVFVYLAGYSFRHLPIIDFLPYKAGVNIREAMEIPDDAPKDAYENSFIYRNKNTGKEKRFTEDNYPWRDSVNWEYVSMNRKLKKKGYTPPIRDFRVETADGEDITELLLKYPGMTFILAVYDPDHANLKTIPAINKIAQYAQEKGLGFIGLTSATPREAELFKVANRLKFDFFYGDEIMLKTMIRSNPGLILLQEGTIIHKWHYNDFQTMFENIRPPTAKQ